MRSAATLASLDLSASPYASLSRAELASLLKAEISAASGMTHIAANITHLVQRGPDQGKALHMLTDDGGRHVVDALIAADSSEDKAEGGGSQQDGHHHGRCSHRAFAHIGELLAAEASIESG